jgi:Calcineurin-like phosphoesterase
MRAPRRVLALVVVSLLAPLPFHAQDLSVPNRPGSLKFAAIGDNGTGEQPEYDVANQMDLWHRRFPFDMVIMLGDNLYGSQGPADFVQKFERPYKPLLAAGVKFYASLGNHDKTSNDSYRLFNMGGERYYTYARDNVRFFVIDSNFLDPPQLAWLESELKSAREPWKTPTFITRSTPMAAATDPRWSSACDWNRS